MGHLDELIKIWDQRPADVVIHPVVFEPVRVRGLVIDYETVLKYAGTCLGVRVPAEVPRRAILVSFRAQGQEDVVIGDPVPISAGRRMQVWGVAEHKVLMSLGVPAGLDPYELSRRQDVKPYMVQVEPSQAGNATPGWITSEFHR